MSAKTQDAERPWLVGYTFGRQAEVITRVRAAGYRDTIALGLASWLAVRAMDLADGTSSATKARYRKILREIGSPEGLGNGRRGRAGTVAAASAGVRAMPEARRRERISDRPAALNLVPMAA